MVVAFSQNKHFLVSSHTLLLPFLSGAKLHYAVLVRNLLLQIGLATELSGFFRALLIISLARPFSQRVFGVDEPNVEY